jgi:6-phospho-3-hexuloisomerase
LKRENVQLTEALETVQGEISAVLAMVPAGEVDALIDALCAAECVFVAGAGRVGLAAQAFAQRLVHLGLRCHWIADVTTPAIRAGDLLLVPSGSGETVHMRLLAELAVQRGAQVATITRNPAAAIGSLAGVVVTLLPDEAGIESVQPMTSLFEQSLFLLFEAMVLLIMDCTAQTEADLVRRHYNLER